jgi:preprotein translocase subunit SecA
MLIFPLPMGILKLIFGDENKKKLKPYYENLKKVNSYADEIKSLSDLDLKEKTKYFKEQLKSGKTLDDILPEAFAVAREAADRTLKERPYDVQIIGGMVIHKNNIAEMRTGEGKTLVATLPTYLNALTEKGVHVVTVNDYLARRDAVWMGQIYDFLGLSIGIINQSASYIYDPNHTNKDKERDEAGGYHIVHEFLRPATRQEAYAADITYGTNSEFGFDYLRDNIEYEVFNLRQRKPHYAIIDEIDSILIDEARTPLIISAPSTEAENLYKVFADISEKLEKEADYLVDEKFKTIRLTDAGITKAEKILGVDNIYTEKGIKYVHHLETSVRAKALFNIDKEYVVKDGQIVIIDEFTGRMQPSRRWSGGLHQAVEAKEGLNVQQESRTYASVSYQNYFKMYERLSGMTGTAETSSEEFYKVYRLDTIIVPTNKDIQRLDQQDLIFQTEIGKFKAITKKIKELNQKGQPVLIGTVSIEKNELLSEFLRKENIEHGILNAKNHEQEAEIIARAGKKGMVTIATNMAGRGVDIKLGGVPFDSEKYEAVKNASGLYVLGTERHEARRIDNQLRGRSGRQGDPGETQFFVSMEDSLMRIFATDTIKNMMGRFGIPEDEPIQNSLISKSIESAQNKIEGFNFDSRKHLLEYDNVLNTQRVSIYSRRRKILEGKKEYIDEEIQKIISVGGEDIKKVMDEKLALTGEVEFYEIMRRMILQTIDNLWVDHLETMDYIRSSVNLRAYGQRDPLVEYKKEGLILFRNLESSIINQIINILPNIGQGAFKQEEDKLKEVVKNVQMLTSDSESGNLPDTTDKVGRNEKVIVVKGDEEIEIKYKKLDQYLSEGWKLKN